MGRLKKDTTQNTNIETLIIKPNWVPQKTSRN